jgi:hypothetical protein
VTDRRTPFSLVLVALVLSSTWAACGGSSAPTCQPVAELCNGKDDDCDGLVDEGFDVGATCSVGVGACARSGVKVCTASGAGTECSAVAGAPAAETCNQLDDNCDGATDEGLADCCVPAATRACGVAVGICQVGTETCSGSGAWGACLGTNGLPVTLPGTVAESCNGLDDDCDGQTDEPDATGCTSSFADQDGDGYGAGTAACLCAPSGTHPATVAGDCDDTNAAVHPGAVEACNGIDDDCNGQTDEGFGLGATCSVGLGACERSGVTVCTADGGGVRCNAVAGTPTAETCNGVDDNCDGVTDEGLAAPFCANQNGVCAGSRKRCGGTSGWLDCTASEYGASYQAVETSCDGLDNNCNGRTDEPFGIGASCSVGVGACQASGVNICLASGAGATCSAFPASPSLEICNGIDDDCDGLTDEENATGCTIFYFDQDRDSFGVTSNSKCLCAATGSYTATVGGDCNDSDAAIHPGATEICNGVDDNCDGITDGEGSAGCTSYYVDADRDSYGAIGSARCLCAANATYNVTRGGDCNDSNASISPGNPEICDGLDNDCDGSTDNGMTAPLCANQNGVCAGARMTCGGASGWQACTAAQYGPYYQSVENLCDGLDNDCDGTTDEGCP